MGKVSALACNIVRFQYAHLCFVFISFGKNMFANAIANESVLSQFISTRFSYNFGVSTLTFSNLLSFQCLLPEMSENKECDRR
jgi:hypothetical protein